MREKEYRRTKKELEAERKAGQLIVDQADAKLAALNLLWSEHFLKLQPCPPQSDAVHSIEVEIDNEIAAINTTEKVIAVNGHAQALIDEAALAFPEIFGVSEVATEIGRRHPLKEVNRTTIAGRLRKLVDEGRLELIQAGVGRRPGKFKRKDCA